MVDYYSNADGVVVTQNAEFFSSDINIKKIIIIRIIIAMSAAVKIDVTFNSGTTWVTLNDGTVLDADELYVFDMPVIINDDFNMRTPTTGGATIRYCRVFAVD